MDEPVILIVDDEEGTRAMIKHFFEKRMRCRIEEMRNGEEALAFLENSECELMIMDIRMPKKSGMEVLDKLLLKTNIPDILVITAWDSMLVAEECAKRGVECIPKPFKLEEVFAKAVNILKEKGVYFPIGE